MECKTCKRWHMYVVGDVGYCALLRKPTSYFEYCTSWHNSEIEEEDSLYEYNKGEYYE